MSHLGRRGIKGEKKVDLFAAFGVFLACVACCMVMGLPQFLALLVGLVCFFLVGLHR